MRSRFLIGYTTFGKGLINRAEPEMEADIHQLGCCFLNHCAMEMANLRHILPKLYGELSEAHEK